MSRKNLIITLIAFAVILVAQNISLKAEEIKLIKHKQSENLESPRTLNANIDNQTNEDWSKYSPDIKKIYLQRFKRVLC